MKRLLDLFGPVWTCLDLLRRHDGPLMVISWASPGQDGEDGQEGQDGETGEPNETGEVKPRRRANLRARVLAELAKSSAEEVRQRLEGELREHDRHIAAAQDRVWVVVRLRV